MVHGWAADVRDSSLTPSIRNRLLEHGFVELESIMQAYAWKTVAEAGTQHERRPQPGERKNEMPGTARASGSFNLLDAVGIHLGNPTIVNPLTPAPGSPGNPASCSTSWPLPVAACEISWRGPEGATFVGCRVPQSTRRKPDRLLDCFIRERVAQAEPPNGPPTADSYSFRGDCADCKCHAEAGDEPGVRGIHDRGAHGAAHNHESKNVFNGC